MVDGRVVHGSEDFERLAPTLPPVMPDWSPVRHYGGYQRPKPVAAHAQCSVHGAHAHAAHCTVPEAGGLRGFWGPLGCSCFAF